MMGKRHTMLTLSKESDYINIRKVEFRAKNITRSFHNHNEVNSLRGHNTLNVYSYVPNNRASKYMKQKLLEMQGEMAKPTIIVKDLIPLSQ